MVWVEVTGRGMTRALPNDEESAVQVTDISVFGID